MSSQVNMSEISQSSKDDTSGVKIVDINSSSGQLVGITTDDAAPPLPAMPESAIAPVHDFDLIDVGLYVSPCTAYSMAVMAVGSLDSAVCLTVKSSISIWTGAHGSVQRLNPS